MKPSSLRRTVAAAALSATLAMGAVVGAGTPAHAAPSDRQAICYLDRPHETLKPDAQVPRSQRYERARSKQVSDMQCWLWWNGYLTQYPNYIEFDREVARAVEQFNLDHGLGRTTTVTPATWDALTSAVQRKDLYRVAYRTPWTSAYAAENGANRVREAYSSIGVSLPDTVQGIIAQGTQISYADLVPGDVVLFRIPSTDPRRANPPLGGEYAEYSVGIYIGGGEVYRPIYELFPPDSLEVGYGAVGMWRFTTRPLLDANGNPSDNATFYRMIP